MEFYIFDINFNRIGVIDNAKAIVWERNLYKISECEIELIPTKEQFDILNINNILIRKDFKNEAMLITSREINNTDNIETLTIKCHSLEVFLYNRYTLSNEKYKDSVENSMRQMILNHFITPIDLNRKINYISLGNLNNFNEEMNNQISLKCVGEELYNISRRFRINFKLDYDFKNKKWIFNTFKGLDRTFEQKENSRAIFSVEFENINNQRLLESEVNFKNVCYVYGAGEGINRKKVILNNQLNGLDRKELVVDARDISDTEETGELIDIEEYNSLLISRGNEKMLDYSKINTFDFDLVPNNNLIYRQDFDLGDKVTILNKKWNVRVNDYITSIRETYDSNGFNISLEIGEKDYKIIKG